MGAVDLAVGHLGSGGLQHLRGVVARKVPQGLRRSDTMAGEEEREVHNFVNWIRTRWGPYGLRRGCRGRGAARTEGRARRVLGTGRTDMHMHAWTRTHTSNTRVHTSVPTGRAHRSHVDTGCPRCSPPPNRPLGRRSVHSTYTFCAFWRHRARFAETVHTRVYRTHRDTVTTGVQCAYFMMCAFCFAPLERGCRGPFTRVRFVDTVCCSWALC